MGARHESGEEEAEENNNMRGFHREVLSGEHPCRERSKITKRVAPATMGGSTEFSRKITGYPGHDNAEKGQVNADYGQA